MEQRYEWYVKVDSEGNEVRMNLKKCNNIKCDRLTKGRGYCCDPCRVKARHGDGTGVEHGEECNEFVKHVEGAVLADSIPAGTAATSPANPVPDGPESLGE